MPSAMAGAAREGAIRSPPPSARAPPPSSIAGAARVGVAGEGRQPAQEHWRRRHGGQRRNARSRARCDVQWKKAIHRATRVISSSQIQKKTMEMRGNTLNGSRCKKHMFGIPKLQS